MSAHRTYYYPERIRRRHTWRSTIAAIAVAAVLGTIVVAVSHGAESMGPVASPVRAFEAVPTPLAPMDGQTLATIRVESFRAGYDTALQDGCRPALASPIHEARR
jgi:hypothetical protein